MDHFEREMVDVLMSELVTNAVVHPPRRCGGNVILRFALSPECIRVEVHDAGEGFSMAEVGKHRNEPGGYGLLMVERGASRWGTHGDDGNSVWFELDRNGSSHT
jgi:anti-sigma regulatory factor (Ser/Thr protein kinase)